ncbi:hypothetical protein KOW79_009716 [Hemibagrus wyckioides]|uniref:Uncharacterized protein n=1 Tax=Hemibagrus wyckioides TaxID=337641 RepID=A0A9D3SJT7_9TELE|nr:hypothetical protein KOW79_009716 [Hemibagrus wyckioides]
MTKLSGSDTVTTHLKVYIRVRRRILIGHAGTQLRFIQQPPKRSSLNFLRGTRQVRCHHEYGPRNGVLWPGGHIPPEARARKDRGTKLTI